MSQTIGIDRLELESLNVDSLCLHDWLPESIHQVRDCLRRGDGAGTKEKSTLSDRIQTFVISLIEGSFLT